MCLLFYAVCVHGILFILLRRVFASLCAELKWSVNHIQLEAGSGGSLLFQKINVLLLFVITCSV